MAANHEPEGKTDDQVWLMVGAVLLLISAIFRFVSYPAMTDDYIWFTSIWFERLADAPGLTAFQETFANYAPTYLYFLKGLTLIPIDSLYSIKTLSLVFDIIIAFFAALVVGVVSPSFSRAKLFAVGASIFLIPTVFMNSSLWGQADAVYVAGVMAALYLMLRRRPLGASLAAGYSFAVKAQSVFFFPALVGWLWRGRRKQLWYFLLIPAVFLVSIVPAWLAGGSLRDLVFVYFNQAGEYDALTMSAPSVYTLINEDWLTTTTWNLVYYAGLFIAGLIALWIIYKMVRAPALGPRTLILFTLFSVLAIPYFLPGMHERYFYMADVISVVCAWTEPRRWYLPALIVGASFFSYMPYLSGAVPALATLDIGLHLPSLALLSAVILSFAILRRQYRQETVSPN